MYQVRDGSLLEEEQIRLLTLVDIFEPLSRDEIEAIQWKHLNTSVAEGETFYTPMDLCETLFVLRRGRVRLYRATPEGREFTIAVVGSGTVFGEMALTGQRLRNAYAEALEESEVSAMCRADVERLILDRPRVGLQLIHLLSDRLATHEVRMEDLALREVPARLARLLLLLIENEGVRTPTSYKIATRYTHQQLGTMIGANREAVTRDELRVQRSEEELAAGTREREAGSLRVRKRVRTDRESIEVPTRREEVSVERVPVAEHEASEAEIGDEEISVPVTEEEVVVEKRPMVKEEVRVRKDVVSDTETVEEDVRREEVEIEDETERRSI